MKNTGKAEQSCVKLASRDALVAAVSSLSDIDRRISTEQAHIFRLIEESETLLADKLKQIGKHKSNLKRLCADKYNQQGGAASSLMQLLS